jgi:hypothetical protein
MLIRAASTGTTTTEGNQGRFSTFPPAVSLVKSSRPAAAHRTRSCRGGSLDQGELVGGGWAEGGSLWRAGDGEGADNDVDDSGSSDRWSSTVKKLTKAVYEVVWSSSMRSWGRGCTDGSW